MDAIPVHKPEHDLFICHAGEDKTTVARPLAEELTKRGWKVWLDELELTLGDSLSSAIDDALARSRFGIVVLSRAFFAKPWPRRELEGLTAREVAAGSKVILPVWHEVDVRYVAQQSPVLADRVGVPTSLGPVAVADKISQALDRAGLCAAAGLAPAHVLQSVEPDSLLTIPASSDAQGDHNSSDSTQEPDFPVEYDIPIDRFDVVQAPIPPIGWAENEVFTVGYPPGWYDTTPTEPRIEGKPALVVLRRDDWTGLPSDFESRGVIRCFSHSRGMSSEFLAAAGKLDRLRAQALRGELVEPLQFVRAGGAPCYTFRVDCTIRIRAFQTRPSAITEVHLFHDGEWFLMQLESDPKFHADYQQALATVLGTLTWK